jgi:hypothetical protein
MEKVDWIPSFKTPRQYSVKRALKFRKLPPYVLEYACQKVNLTIVSHY